MGDDRRRPGPRLASWAVVAVMAIGAAAAIINVAVDHVLDVQVVVVCVGGLLLVVGAAVIVRGWQSRATSEWRGLVVAAGFFSACVGVFVTAIGSGLFH